MKDRAPRLSQFGSAIGWLLSRDVSSTRLAALLETTPENIRVIAHRARYQKVFAAREVNLRDRPNGETARTVGIRPALDDAAWTAARTRKLDSLKENLELAVAGYAAEYEFLAGASKLRQFLTHVGYAGDARRIAFAAEVHQQIAWFLTHSGRSASAIAAARSAQDLWRIAWHETGFPDHARGFIRAALIGSQAHLLSRNPNGALKALDIADAAAQSIGAPPRSDHFRQRGVALLQLREDAQAAKYFARSSETMQRLNEATCPAQILMTGARHTGILGNPNPDIGQRVLFSAEETFGRHSLEAAMALHWSAAASLCSDSPSLIVDASEQLTTHSAPLPQFGHQATIRRLLLLTPHLGLDIRLRRAWIRRALYENAFQSR